MSFPLKDLRFTTRRNGGEVVVYPRLLRDRSILPKVDIAVQYFESMLGAERRSLDPEVLVQFFGDHKLARCMVACLARAYRYRSRPLDEIASRAAVRKLQRAGIASSKSLRLLVYDRVNERGPGFLPAAEREGRIADLEREFGLRRGELERLLYLDADEHAILSRVGAAPRGPDVVAQHNVGALATLLRHAEEVELSLARWSPLVRDSIEEIAAANGVDIEVAAGPGGGARVRLLGRQDALGTWIRHGRKVSRMVIQLLERGRTSIDEGSARLVVRERRLRLRLTAELLDTLAGSESRQGAAEAGWVDDEGWGPLDLARALREPRSARDGARLRRLPDPSAWASGVAVPELLLQVGARSALVCAVRSPVHARRLAQIAPAATSGDPLLLVGLAASLAPLVAIGAWTLPMATFDVRAVVEAMRLSGAETARVA